MSSPSEPRFRRLDPDRRRTQILASAARHFGEKPYGAVSMAEIAKDAGVVRGLVHHYFRNKRELYLAVVESVMFLPPAALHAHAGGTRSERVGAAIDWLMDVIEAHGRGWLAIATAGGFGADPEVQKLLDAADDLAADSVLELVGFTGSGAELESARAAVRALGGMAKEMGRELVDRRSVTSKQARLVLTASLTAIVDLIFSDEGLQRS